LHVLLLQHREHGLDLLGRHGKLLEHLADRHPPPAFSLEDPAPSIGRRDLPRDREFPRNLKQSIRQNGQIGSKALVQVQIGYSD
jgi:hypothetical protein